MKFENFRITASPAIIDAYCSKCGNSLVEVSNGWLRSSFYCSKCEAVFTIKLIKVPPKKISAGYLEQCRKEAKGKKAMRDCL